MHGTLTRKSSWQRAMDAGFKALDESMSRPEAVAWRQRQHDRDLIADERLQQDFLQNGLGVFLRLGMKMVRGSR